MKRRRHCRRNPRMGQPDNTMEHFLFGAVVGFGVFMLSLQLATVSAASAGSTMATALQYAGPGVAGYLVGGGAGVLGALTAQAATVAFTVEGLKNIG